MLRLLNKFMLPLLAPVVDAGAADTKMGKEDIIKFLGEDEELDDKPIDLKEKIEKVTKGKDKEEDPELEAKDDDSDLEENSEEDIELAELDNELEGPTEEQLELVTPVRRAEILKKYPSVFKDFPYLEKAYYREQQFTEIFPTLDEAREAVSSKETLDHFESDLIKGDTEKILSSVKSTSPKGFAKLVDDYLPTLARVDEKSYHHVIGNILSHTIQQMVAEGKRGKNEALEAAAHILNQFAFGTSDYVAPKKLTVEEDDKPDEKTSELERRENEINQREFIKAKDEISTRVNNVLKATIDGNIDPKESMTSYVKKQASREAMETISELIEKDSRFRVILDKQWEVAAKNNFDKSSMERIRQTCITKAKSLLPSVIKKARNEALKGMGKRVKEDEEVETERPERTGPIKTKGKESAPSGNKQGFKSSARPIRKGESTADYLLSDD